MNKHTFLLLASLHVFVADCNSCLLCPGNTKSHNIDHCNVFTANKNLLGTNIYEPARFLSTVTRMVTYPEFFSQETKDIITCIKVINLDTTDRGGYPAILSGGVGSYDVQILLTSQWGQPINFRIEIWADN